MWKEEFSPSASVGNLWEIKKFKGNTATRYGTLMEPRARKQYTKLMLKKDPHLVIEETGLWVKKSIPYLGCSPDAVVKKNGKIIRIVEIKCPYILRDVHPKRFAGRLTQTQLQNFPLKHKSNGKVAIRKHHAYYYQVQMQMDVMKVKVCDFFMWSKNGCVRLEIPYDPSFWLPKRDTLDLKHRGLLMPEYFLMRTPRNLEPWDFNDLEENDMEDLL